MPAKIDAFSSPRDEPFDVSRSPQPPVGEGRVLRPLRLGSASKPAIPIGRADPRWLKTRAAMRRQVPTIPTTVSSNRRRRHRSRSIQASAPDSTHCAQANRLQAEHQKRNRSLTKQTRTKPPAATGPKPSRRSVRGDEPEQEAAENHRDQAKREDTLHAGQARECEVLEGRSKVVSVVPRMILHCADSRKILRDIEFVHPETASARRCEKSHKADERPCGRDPGRCPGWLLPKSR